MERGATSYCHWFQPLGASNVRLGMTGQVHNTFFAFDKDGKPIEDFKEPKHLTELRDTMQWNKKEPTTVDPKAAQAAGILVSPLKAVTA